MFDFLKPNLRQNMKNNLLNIKRGSELFNKMTTMQNEISVNFNNKVIAITSINSDSLAAAFGKGYADTFVFNGEKALIIDANLYNPKLAKLLEGVTDQVEITDNASGKKKKTVADQKANVICMDKEIYPSEIFKSGVVSKLIEENKANYDRFIVLVPSIKEHKELVLLKGEVDSVILVTQRNSTKKADIFYAIEYCRETELPLAKTVVLK